MSDQPRNHCCVWPVQESLLCVACPRIMCQNLYMLCMICLRIMCGIIRKNTEIQVQESYAIIVICHIFRSKNRARLSEEMYEHHMLDSWCAVGDDDYVLEYSFSFITLSPCTVFLFPSSTVSQQCHSSDDDSKPNNCILKELPASWFPNYKFWLKLLKIDNGKTYYNKVRRRPLPLLPTAFWCCLVDKLYWNW